MTVGEPMIRAGLRLATGVLVLALALLTGGPGVWAGPPRTRAPASEPRSAGHEVAVEQARPIDRSERNHLVWKPASVVWPATSSHVQSIGEALALLEPRDSSSAAPAPSVRGPIDLDHRRGALVWLDALETVRVRRLEGSGELRFWRIVDAHAAVLEPGIERSADTWELFQPPGSGTLWLIERVDASEAAAPVRVIVERPFARSSRFVDVEVEREVLDWIHAEGSAADLPPLAGSQLERLEDQLRLQLLLGHELSRLGGTDRSLGRAIEAWRMLAAMQELDRERPSVRPYFAPALRSERLPGTDANSLRVPDSRDYREAQPGRWTIDRRGPGRLEIVARSVATRESPEQLGATELRVWAGGRLLARLDLSSRAARRSPDTSTALPMFEPLETRDGRVVGELASLELSTAPGRVSYELELVGGPALVLVEGARRIETSAMQARGWTPARRLGKARRQLERSDSDMRPFLAALIDAQAHAPIELEPDDARLARLAEQSPALALELLATIALQDDQDAERVHALGMRALALLDRIDGDRSFDSRLRGRLRTHWLEVAAAWRDVPLAEALIGGEAPSSESPVIAELPVDGLRLLAELLGPTDQTRRSTALALLELARRRDPANPDLRRQYLRMWSMHSRWSQRIPTPREGGRLDPLGTWLVQREVRPAAHESGWLRLVPGQAVRVRAELTSGHEGMTAPLAAGTERRRIFDLHVATPERALDPVRVRIDDELWWSPMLDSVQRHRFAIAPGEHEIQLDGPPGTIAWVELPPVHEPTTRTPDAFARRERLWSLADAAWRLPGPPAPGFVRLELRWLANVPVEPVTITMHEDGSDRVQTLVFDPRQRTPGRAAIDGQVELDDRVFAVEDSPAVSTEHRYLFAIAATTTKVWFEVDRPGPIAAGLSLRRDLHPDERPGDAQGVAMVERDVSDPALELPVGDTATLIDELAALSRELLLDPDDLDARARRALILLTLGETGHARADLARLASVAESPELSPKRRARADELRNRLLERFALVLEPREVTVQTELVGQATMLVEPAITAVVGNDRDRLTPALALWAEGRARQGDDALLLLDPSSADAASFALADLQANDPLLLALTRAHWLTAAQRWTEAARLWVRLYGRMPGSHTPGGGRARSPVAVGLAAVLPLSRRLDDPSTEDDLLGLAGLAYGLARELEPAYGHTTIRWLAFVAASRSDSSSLDHSEGNAGFERLELPRREVEPSPSALVREALLAPPWIGERPEQLQPGRKGVLAFDATPGTLALELWCRNATEQPGPAKLDVRLIGDDRSAAVEREIEPGDAVVERVELAITSEGRHQLELTLDADPTWSCAWRASTRAAGSTSESPIEPRRRAQWWTAAPEQPVELIVLGPTSLQLEVRGVVVDPAAPLDSKARGPATLVASIEAIGEPAPDDPLGLDPDLRDRFELALSRSVEAPIVTERRRTFSVSEATADTILLTEPRPYLVRLTPDRGRALVRATLRRDRPDLPPPTRGSARELEPTFHTTADPRWPVPAPSQQPIEAIDRQPRQRNRVGSFEVLWRGGVDDLSDVDDLRPRIGSDLRVGYRRALLENRLWIFAAAELHVRERSPVAGGGLLRLGARFPRSGLRAGAEVLALDHAWAGGSATAVRVQGFIDRPTWISPHLQLVPSLDLAYRWQSLQPGDVDDAGSLEPHPLVYTRYVHDHPLVLRPELELRAYPLQDLAAFVELAPIMNSNFASLDYLDLEVGVEGIVREPRAWVPIYRGAYQSSLRFADEDRPSFYVRHRLEASLGAGVWWRDDLLISFGVRDRLYLNSGSELPPRNVLELWLRLDGVFGRRLRDQGPRERWFREPWAPRAWADEQVQAESTTLGRQVE